MEFSLNTDAGRPAYQQLEVQVADGIAQGRLGPGDRLPPERDLALALGISRMTVRQAFDALARRGLVERGVGRGTFVAAPTVELDRRDRLASFTEQLERAGLAPGAEVLEAVVRSATPEVAQALELSTGDSVARVRRVRFGGGMPIALEDTWIPDVLFPGIVTRDLTGSIYALMRTEYQRPVARATEYLQAVAARAGDAVHLGVRARSPLILAERVAFDDAGVPLEVAWNRYRGDRTRFVIEHSSESDRAQLTGGVQERPRRMSAA